MTNLYPREALKSEIPRDLGFGAFFHFAILPFFHFARKLSSHELSRKLDFYFQEIKDLGIQEFSQNLGVLMRTMSVPLFHPSCTPAPVRVRTKSVVFCKKNNHFL